MPPITETEEQKKQRESLESAFVPETAEQQEAIDVAVALIPTEDTIQKEQEDLQKEAEATAAITAPTAPGFVSSSAPVVEEERVTAADVQAITPAVVEPAVVTASQEFLLSLDTEIAALESRREQEIADIEASFVGARESIELEQAKERGATAATLARLGGFLGPSGSATGVLLNLNKSHRDEISTLESKKAQAIQEANNAITDQQFALARLRVQEVKDIEETINDRKNEFFDQSLALQKEERLSRIDPFFSSASIVSLMKDIPIGETVVVTDPNTGSDFQITGIRTSNPNVKTIQSTDKNGFVTITSYNIDPDGNLSLISQENAGQVGKGQAAPFSIQFPRQSRQAIFDSSGIQIGWQTFNPVTTETNNFDLNGNQIQFPEGGRLGTFSQTFDEGGISNEDLAGF